MFEQNLKDSEEGKYASNMIPFPFSQDSQGTDLFLKDVLVYVDNCIPTCGCRSEMPIA